MLHLKRSKNLSPYPIPGFPTIRFLKKVTNGNTKLLHAWTSFNSLHAQSTNAVATMIYEEYMTCLHSTAENLEDSIIDNSTSQKVNAVESNYLDPYTSADSLYAETTEVLVFMREQGGVDVDVFQDFFECIHAFQKGNPRPKDRTRRAPRGPTCQELRIKDHYDLNSNLKLNRVGHEIQMIIRNTLFFISRNPLPRIINYVQRTEMIHICMINIILTMSLIGQPTHRI